MVACCLCGIQIESNPSNMCSACLQARVDITEGISRNEVVYYCKSCDRFSEDETRFIQAELESAELLALCLKGIHGLSKGKGKHAAAKIVDASWKWTEPHSRRLKINIVVEKELSEYNNVVVKQHLVTEFQVKYKMCKDCTKTTTNQQWTARVQLRQKVEHKRTLLNLEQKLRKAGILKAVLDIVQVKNGLDFYFADKADANKFVETVLQLIPSRRKKESKHLKGTDTRNNTYRFEYSISLEASHICKLDLVVLPKRLNGSLFNGKPTVVLCDQVTKSLHMLDPATGHTGVVGDTSIFELEPLQTSKDLVKFVVLDCVMDHSRREDSKYKVAEIEVARESDFGINNERFTVLSHLGGFLEAGDMVMGYDLTHCNFPDDLLAPLKGRDLPSVVLVKKAS